VALVAIILIAIVVWAILQSKKPAPDVTAKSVAD